MKRLLLSFIVFALLLTLYFSLANIRLIVSCEDTETAQTFHPESVTVKYEMFPGIQWPVRNAWYQVQDGNITVWAGSKKTTQTLFQSKGTYTATYNGTAYAGQMLNPELVSVTASYPDGTTQEISEIELSPVVVPMTDSFSVNVRVPKGDVELTVPVTVPSSRSLSYDATAAVGDQFDVNRLRLLLSYEDGTQYGTSEFEVQEAPKYLTEETEVSVTSDYGDVTGVIKPKAAQAVSATYDGVVYEGGNLDNKAVKATFTNGKDVVEELTDLQIPNPGSIRERAVLTIGTPMGDARLVIDPVKVEEAFAYPVKSFDQDGTIDLDSILVLYEDGKQEFLKSDDVNLHLADTSLSSGYNTFWFDYNGIYQQCYALAVSKDVMQLRESAEQGVRYHFSSFQLDTLSRIAMRYGQNDVQALAYELSLMLNRYEQYGNDVEFTEDGLISYVMDSGYWGNIDTILANTETSVEAQEVAMDVLNNGYRQLPSYVDVRTSSDNVITGDEMFVSGQTTFQMDGITATYYGSSATGYVYGYTGEISTESEE